jgi:hypothetical protein
MAAGRDGRCDNVNVIFLWEYEGTVAISMLRVTDGPHKLRYGDTL